MTSIDDRAMLDEIIANNGVDGEQTVTHIIEYQNQFDGRTAEYMVREHYPPEVTVNRRGKKPRMMSSVESIH